MGPGPIIFWISGKTSKFYANAQLRFESVVLDSVPATSNPDMKIWKQCMRALEGCVVS